MQDGERSVAELRELAIKCRKLAAQVSDERAAASLRKLAEEYEEAADAAHQFNGFHWNPPAPES